MESKLDYNLKLSAYRKNKKYSEKGQTIMELIVVVSVSVIIIGALVFATISSLRNAQFSKNQTQATKLAQEAIEWVRVGRDRNQCILGLGSVVSSWNGNSTNSDCTSAESVWEYNITGSENNCENTLNSSKCYFKVQSSGVLTMVGYSQTSFPEDQAEGIPQNKPIFKRVITLSDDPSSKGEQKTVTALVQWTDFSGSHQSQLTTILRNLTK